MRRTDCVYIPSLAFQRCLLQTASVYVCYIVIGCHWSRDVAGARKPPRARRRVARCVSPYSTDSNYEGPDTAPRRRPQRRRQPRHQHGTSPATGSVAATGDARSAAAAETQPSAVNSPRPRPPPVAAKPRGASYSINRSRNS